LIVHLLIVHREDSGQAFRIGITAAARSESIRRAICAANCSALCCIS